MYAPLCQYITSLLSFTPPPLATSSPPKVRVEYSCGSVEYTTAYSTPVGTGTELVRKPTGIYWARGTDPNSLVTCQSGFDTTAISLCLVLSLLGSPSSSVTIGACWGASCIPSAWFSQGCPCLTSTADKLSLLFGIAINSGVAHLHLGGAISGTSTTEAVDTVGSASLLPANGGIQIVIGCGGSTSMAGSGGGPPDQSPGRHKVVT